MRPVKRNHGRWSAAPVRPDGGRGGRGAKTASPRNIASNPE
uniref:Uncharacterized protein n=1 Tax=uncultured bacterium contig00146 TaxID=1181586 RepID=A0A806KGL3_9BACT|nr:hypothetical protein [uncultured bacterium contig00146]